MNAEKQLVSTTAMAQAGILTRDQLADELGITDQTLRNWERAGLPDVRQKDVILYYVPSVVKWLLKNRRESARGAS